MVCGTSGLPTATVQMLGPDGITHVATGLGTGPVDAAYKAIDSLVRVPVPPPHPLRADVARPAAPRAHARLREQYTDPHRTLCCHDCDPSARAGGLAEQRP